MKQAGPLTILVFMLTCFCHSLNGQEAESFEAAKSGPFKTLSTDMGTWAVEQGWAQVDDQHAKSGKQCLQIAGDESTLVLSLKQGITKDHELTFWAERWTARAPFRFRIEQQTDRGWKEIYNGDQSVKVGRAFLSRVRIPLNPMEGNRIERLRLRVDSPKGTGVLLDDLKILPLVPMQLENVEVVPCTLPALVRTPASALVKVKITVSGTLNPLQLTRVQARLSDEFTRAQIAHWQPYYTGSSSSFKKSQPFGKPQSAIEAFSFDGTQTLVEGDNYLWLACQLKPDANIDGQLWATINGLEFSDGTRKRIDASPTLQRMGVAVRLAGDDGVHTYRIPGLATTNQGTLIGVYDIRRDGGRDLPGDIDVGMSRSVDGGRTWQAMQVIMDMGDDPKWNGDGIGDPSVLVDRKTGTIWVSATWSHGNRSWNGSGPGLTPEETGQWMLVKSDDDGVTWSKPINITAQVKRKDWCFLLQGPGKGITMSDGTIVFPAQYQDPPNDKNRKAHRLPRSTFIYSRDHGITWSIATGAWDDTTESQLVELADKQLMINCRTNRSSNRGVLTTSDMGATWIEHATHLKALQEPRACMASLINVGRELRWRQLDTGIGNSFLLFSNPNSLQGRNHMTMKASSDSGKSWPSSQSLLLDQENGFGYSCMTMIDDQTVGILYEGSQAHMTFQRVKLKDVLETSIKSK